MRPAGPKRNSVDARRQRAAEILAGLERLYPEAECELTHDDPFQLLIATILSAQTTDKAVNQVTPTLFARYPDADSLAHADPLAVERSIATIGLFRTKSKSIIGAARVVSERFNGRVPADREALQSLPGVGRKTANVVLSSAFGAPALAVDTHVRRLARLLGLSRHTDPTKIEHDLTALFPRARWGFVSHALIWHGRRVCVARAPHCAECGLKATCPSAFQTARPTTGRKPTKGSR